MFILIHKMLPDREGVVKFRCGFETYETLKEAEKASYEPVRQNLPYRSEVVEIENPWELDQ